MIDNTLPSVSKAISIAVIICMTLTFAVLFILYTFAKNRGIKSGSDDEELRADLIRDYNKRVGFCERTDENTGETVTVREMGYCEFLDSRARRCKLPKIITDVIFIAIIAFIFAITVTAWVFRANGEQLFIGDTAYLTIRSGSMSEINSSHPYADELPDNRIAMYSLIGIEKLRDEKEIKLYDIIAFKSSDGKIYVHRVIGFFTLNGQRYFTTMGDANASSAADEADITFDRIVGRYNGYQNKVLGYCLIYLNSDIGIIALLFALLFVITVDLAESKIGVYLKKRTFFIASLLDGGEAEADVKAPETGSAPIENAIIPLSQNESEHKPEETALTQETAVAPTPETAIVPIISEIAPNGDTEEEIIKDDIPDGFNTVRYDRSFTAKLVKSNDILKERYSEIKNELLSYPKVRATLSWRYESFNYGRKRVARMSIRGATLCVYLALSPEDYVDTKYKLEDVSEQISLGELKCLYRIKNDRRVKYVKELLAKIFESYGAQKGAQSERDWYLPYNGDAVLLQNGLIKRKIVKVFKDGTFGKPDLNEEEPEECADELTDEAAATVYEENEAPNDKKPEALETAESAARREVTEETDA